MITDEKILFDDAFLKEIQDKFYYVHEDYLGRKRQFFENSGGSLRRLPRTYPRHLHDA